jgi:hypothetical protein
MEERIGRILFCFLDQISYAFMITAVRESGRARQQEDDNT